MKPYQTLVLILAHEPHDEAALAQAATLAARCQTSLQVFQSLPDQADPAAARAGLESRLRSLAPGVVVNSALFSGQVDDPNFIEHIRQLHPDLVIKSLQAATGLRRLFSAPDDWQLASQLPCPVWLIGHALRSPPSRAIAAVDIGGNPRDDALNHRVIVETRRLVQVLGAELHLAHICEPVVAIPEDAALQMIGTPPGLAAELEKLHQDRFDDIAAAHQVAPERRHLGHGYVPQGLEELGDKLDAQIIAVGSHDHSRLQRLLLGSVSADLVRHGRHSLMLISTRCLGAPERDV